MLPFLIKAKNSSLTQSELSTFPEIRPGLSILPNPGT